MNFGPIESAPILIPYCRFNNPQLPAGHFFKVEFLRTFATKMVIKTVNLIQFKYPNLTLLYTHADK